MRPLGSGRQLAERRIKAVRMIECGNWNVSEASHHMKVSVRAVYDWLKRYRDKGKASLEEKKNQGRKPALSKRDLLKLERILLKGAIAYGFDTDLWTCPRVAVVIEETFGVSYHTDHVWKILFRKLGWSAQKPARQAIEKDEGAISHWKRYKLREIKKKLGNREQR